METVHGNILVVEDSAIVALEVADLLKNAGYRVLGPVANDVNALRLIRTERIDAALLDVNLGGMNSFPIAYLLKLNEIPFAFVTGYEFKQIAPVDFAAVPFLQKPFSDSSLLAIVAELLEDLWLPPHAVNQ